MSDPFDVIPYEDISGDWKKLGSGSFGNVYKGSYLGIDVAIKEVLPSTEYDVAKYFEREWRLMKECRHPNICLFIGLSRAPHPDNRIFIISEFIENGNVRLYIHDKAKPFPWPLRLSFATDAARALAYLHARKCIHRDMKGENLLVTANGRLKITDFGFARIAARNEEELKRLTFCGTDAYMSPEILQGDEFDLPTDVFSLGVIFCEIAARRLADDHAFKRSPPEFGIDEQELRERASPGCPPDFIQLCLDCCRTDPAARPTTRNILERLRLIEAEVLLRPSEGANTHVGSIKFMSGGKRPVGKRIPSFGMGVGKDIRTSGAASLSASSAEEESDEELLEAVAGLESVGVSSSGWSAASHEPLLNGSNGSEYSTTVIRGHAQQGTLPPSLSSILTIRPSPDPNATADPVLPATPPSTSPSPSSSFVPTAPPKDDPALAHTRDHNGSYNTSSAFSIATIDSYHTAISPSSSLISSTLATEGGSTIRSLHPTTAAQEPEAEVAPLLVHRFTLLKPGAKQPRRISGNTSPGSPGSTYHPTGPSSPASVPLASWNPLDLFFSSALLVAKCDLCTKRLGWKPVLECDDCGLRAHVKCGEGAPRDCGVRPVRFGAGVAGAGSSPLKGMKSQSPARR